MASMLQFRDFPITLTRLILANALSIICLGLVIYSWKDNSPKTENVIQTCTLSNSPRSLDNPPPDSSSHRWEKVFYDIYDTPNPLSFRIGPDNVKNKDKYFIYRCDESSMSFCGGWGNRAKGVIAAYIFANLTGRVFKSEILMDDCDFERFLVPNRVNWSLPQPIHRKVVKNHRVKVMNMFMDKTFYDNFKKVNWLKKSVMKSDFVYFKTNYDMLLNFRDAKYYRKQLHWMKGEDRVSLNRFLFTHIFKPSSYLRNKVVNFLTENVGNTEKLLCLHMRMGQNPTMPQDFRRGVNFTYLPNVWNTVNQRALPNLGDNTKIFLMTDSYEVIAEAKKQAFSSRIFIAPGEIVHIEESLDVTSKQVCDGLEKVLFEQQVLLHCDSLILSDSSISRMAAYVRGRDDQLYCMLYSTGEVVQCKLSEMVTKDIFDTRG